MAVLNRRKAELLYSAIDGSDGFYRAHAAPADRSAMNVAFRLPTKALDRRFLQEAEEAGLAGLGGHRSLGGIRASIYNAVTVNAVEELCQYMLDFRGRIAS